MQTVQKKQAYVLTGVDYETLDLFHQYGFLTASQMLRLRYSPGSLSTCQDRLKHLFDNRYLNRRQLPHVGTGNTDYFYYLSTKGQKELQAIGITTGFLRVRKADVDTKRLPHLQHIQYLNDFLIAGRLLSQSIPEISLVEMRHDFDLKKTPIKVSYDCQVNGSRIKEQTTIIPDAWMDWRYSPVSIGKEKRRVLVIELDTGSTDQTRIRRKFRAYCEAAVSEQYISTYGTNLITVVYITPAGETRSRQLLSWLENELTLQHLEEEQKLFRIGTLPTSLDSREIFLQPNFYKPFDTTPVSLLWSLSS